MTGLSRPLEDGVWRTASEVRRRASTGMEIPSVCDGSTPAFPPECHGHVAPVASTTIGTGVWMDMGGGSNEGYNGASEMKWNPRHSDEAHPPGYTLKSEVSKFTGDTMQSKGGGDGVCCSDNFVHQRRVDVEGIHKRSDK